MVPLESNWASIKQYWVQQILTESLIVHNISSLFFLFSYKKLCVYIKLRTSQTCMTRASSAKALLNEFEWENFREINFANFSFIQKLIHAPITIWKRVRKRMNSICHPSRLTNQWNCCVLPQSALLFLQNSFKLLPAHYFNASQFTLAPPPANWTQ